MTKTSQDNNLNHIHFFKHFYEYHTEKLNYRDVTCLILKVLPWWICYYCFCSDIQSLVELESVIVATAPYFEHTAPLTYYLFLFSTSHQNYEQSRQKLGNNFGHWSKIHLTKIMNIADKNWAHFKKIKYFKNLKVFKIFH